MKTSIFQQYTILVNILLIFTFIIYCIFGTLLCSSPFKSFQWRVILFANELTENVIENFCSASFGMRISRFTTPRKNLFSYEYLIIYQAVSSRKSLFHNAKLKHNNVIETW